MTYVHGQTSAYRLRQQLDHKDRIIAALLRVAEPPLTEEARRHRHMEGIARREVLEAQIDAHREARCAT